jgi:hypothetical protein
MVRKLLITHIEVIDPRKKENEKMAMSWSGRKKDNHNADEVRLDN